MPLENTENSQRDVYEKEKHRCMKLASEHAIRIWYEFQRGVIKCRNKYKDAECDMQRFKGGRTYNEASGSGEIHLFYNLMQMPAEYVRIQ